jgi:ribonuclease HI
MTNKINTESPDMGMVLYCDGGAKPNPGFNGWGVHGYLYENTLPKKGTGNLSHVLTANGYVPKAGKAAVVEIKPISYFDGFGSSLTNGTNNVAELHAMCAALDKAAEYPLKKLSIFTDSDITKRGVNEWLPMWLARDWIKTDGNPVANTPEWKLVNAKLNLLKSRGVEIVVDWVKAHTEGVNREIGNIVADKLATIGVKYSSKRELRCQFKLSAADGYWNKVIKKHPFMLSRRMYFNTVASTFTPGQYYMGNHGKDDDLLGVKNGDGAFCYLEMKESDEVLEAIRHYQTELAKGAESLVMVRLDALYSPEIYNDLIDFGMHSLNSTGNKLDLYTLGKEPLTKEFRPAKLAMRAVESLSFMSGVLQRYKENDPKLIKLDLTDTFYTKEVTVKKGVDIVSLKFKPEYFVGFCALPIEFDYKHNEKDVKLKTVLTLGIDCLNRNGLKNLEDLNPKVTMIFWKEGDEVLRFATVIETEGNIGIWCGVYSNMIFINKA